MKQKQFYILDTAGMVLTSWAIGNGLYGDVSASEVPAFKTEFLSYVRTRQPSVLDVVNSSGAISDESKQILAEAVRPPKSSYAYQV